MGPGLLSAAPWAPAEVEGFSPRSVKEPRPLQSRPCQPRRRGPPPAQSQLGASPGPPTWSSLDTPAADRALGECSATLLTLRPPRINTRESQQPRDADTITSPVLRSRELPRGEQERVSRGRRALRRWWGGMEARPSLQTLGFRPPGSALGPAPFSS